jgi:hypothetical protein
MEEYREKYNMYLPPGFVKFYHSFSDWLDTHTHTHTHTHTQTYNDKNLTDPTEASTYHVFIFFPFLYPHRKQIPLEFDVY